MNPGTQRLLGLMLILSLPFFAGCHQIPPLPSSPPPDVHLWDDLYTFGEEEPGFGTYTYVLAGRDASDARAATRYTALVNAVRSSTTARDDIPREVDKSRFNLFLIPVDANGEPNYALSKLLLAALTTTASVSFDKPGPFLITLYRPIGFGTPGDVVDVLFVDLTNTHETAIREVVRTYKNRISGETIEGIEKLKSLRLAVLNLALLAEDNIGFAKAAYADLKEGFGER